jgi:hypothetical protein
MSQSLGNPQQHAPAFLNLTGEEPVHTNRSTSLLSDHQGHESSAVVTGTIL